MKILVPVLLAFLLSACGSLGSRAPAPGAVSPARPEGSRPKEVQSTLGVPTSSTPTAVPKKGGGYYQDDGPGDNAPADLASIPDAMPKDEPLHRFANNPYFVLGRDYVPMRSRAPYRERGVGSWYGKKFHGQKTSSGEPYDMYGMTAAHPTLPIPSYVRVTNPANGKSVVVRVNDRGPFHSGRVIDLSYTAAWKLGYIASGSTLVEVETVAPGTQLAVTSTAGIALPAGSGSAEQCSANSCRRPAPTFDEDPIARLASLPEPTPPPAAKGAFLQLGAFGNPDNAETFRARIARELEWAGDKLSTQSAGALHRVQIGPFASRAEAESVAEQVRSTLGIKPAIVVR